MEPRASGFANRAALLLVGAVLMAQTGSLAGPAPQGLDQAYARRSRLARKTMDRLSHDGQCQTERLIFHDTETGAEVWRLTFDPSANYADPGLGHTPWNCDGSALVFMSDRGMPGVWKREGTGRGDAHPYVMSGDGATFRYLPLRTPEGEAMGGRSVIWDVFNPRRNYWFTDAALYALDLTSGGQQVVKIADLPHPERRKDLWCVPSEHDLIMVKDFNVSASAESRYEGELYFVDPRKRPGEPGFLTQHPWACHRAFPGHDPAKEAIGFHDVYFRRTPDDAYIFNYGPFSDVGEAVFLQAPREGNPAQVKLVYPDEAHGVPYYSHPSWSATGRLVSYFGVAALPEVDPGWQVREHDARRHVVRLLPGWIGGHVAWNGYDEDWVVAAVSAKEYEPQFDGWVFHAHIPSGKAEKLVRHYSGLNGEGQSYLALPRPTQSPDATKCSYHSTMLHADNETTDLYVAVSHRPAPPPQVTARRAASGVVGLSWQPPKMHREIKGYRVYRRVGSEGGWVEITGGPLAGTQFVDREAPSVCTYFVTSEEHSGLESDHGSPVVELTRGTERLLPAVTKWDKTPPEPPARLEGQLQADGRVALQWQPSPSSEVRYYQVYYSPLGPPEIAQSNRIVSPGADARRYLDWGLDPAAKSHWYAITAVDRQGNESAPSRVVVTRPD